MFGAALTVCASTTLAQTLGAAFSGQYVIHQAGTPANVPAPLGGIAFLPQDSNILLIGGAANSSAGAIYAVPLARGSDGRITGFAGPGVLYATAPYIDGGLTFGPGGVLFYATYTSHTIGQIKPGSTKADKVTSLTGTGIGSSTGTLQFVPPGYPGEGQLKIASYNGWTWHTVGLTPDGNGTYTLGPFGAAVPVTGGPEGIVFVRPGNPGFTQYSILLSEYSAGRVSAYDLDAHGDPILATRRDFITGLGGAEGGTRDPNTGDYLFSTFNSGNKLLVISGFNRECRADLNADGVIDDVDFVLFAQAYDVYDCGVPTMPLNCQADLNTDGVVDDIDFVLFAQAYDAYVCE